MQEDETFQLHTRKEILLLKTAGDFNKTKFALVSSYIHVYGRLHKIKGLRYVYIASNAEVFQTDEFLLHRPSVCSSIEVLNAVKALWDVSKTLLY